MLNDYVSDLDSAEGYARGDEEDIAELEKRFDKFFDDHVKVFIATLGGYIKKLLRQAQREFDGDDDVVKELEGRVGIRGDQVVRYKDGVATVLFAIGTMGAIRSDLASLLLNSFNGEVKRKDLRKHILTRTSRRYHDFFETFMLASLMHTYNAAQIKYAKKKGYKKFLYVGGLVDESREFCIQRSGHEFTIEEAETWNDMWWKGKIEGVDFFVQIGGYNCGHYLEFIDES